MNGTAAQTMLRGMFCRVFLFVPLTLLACTRVIAGNDLGLLLLSANSLVVLSESGGSTTVAEAGGSDFYTVVLARAPAADVSVTITPDTQVLLDAGSAPLVIDFSPANWNQARTISVAAADDGLREGTHTGTISHAVSSADGDFARSNPGNIAVSILDDDSPSVVIAESGGATQIAETGSTSDAYSIRLNTEPAASTTISIAFDNAQVRVNSVSVSPVNIVFNSICPGSLCWSTPRTITVTAVDDAFNENTLHNSLITHASTSLDPDYNAVDITNITASIQDNEGDVTSPTVVTVDPSEGTAVGTNTFISVTFSEAMDPTFLTVNTADNACVDSIQVSRAADNFATNTCVRMQSLPAASNGDKTFTFRPFVSLSASDTYLVRATTNALDTAGNPLAGQFTTGTGIFTASGPDVTAPAQAASNPFNPANNAADIAVTSSITITMNDFMQPGLMTTNVLADTTCSGTFQLSLDNFASCVPMQAQPVPGANHTIWTITPLAPLLEDTQYQVRVNGTKDAANNDQGAAINWTFQTAD